MASKARQQLLNLLGQAPDDTLYSLTWFLRTKICERVGTPLAEIGDKALAKHLNALINGPTQLSGQTSSRARKAAQGSPLKAEFMLWGIGSASNHGEWPEVVAAVDRLANAKQWTFGRTLDYVAALLQITPSNRLTTDAIAMLLDGTMSHRLSEHVKQQGLGDLLDNERELYC